ncbi:MAG TPA: hypothetical protein VF796_08495, partial [Humisphaera sp.]
MPISTAVQKLGFKLGGSSANQAIAALKAYGLIDVDGSGDDRRVTVSDAAARIMLKHPDGPALLRKAALAPKLHAELYGRFFGEDGLAPDDVIRTYLVFDRPDGNFAEQSVGPFIRQFKQSLAFAGVNSSGKLEPAADDTAEPDGSDGAQGGGDAPADDLFRVPPPQGKAAPMTPTIQPPPPPAPPPKVEEWDGPTMS